MDSSASRTDLSALLDHSEWLHALARRLVGDPGAADDLVQETWIAALRNPPDLGRPARPWLAGVLRKLVLLRRRSEGRRTGRHEAVAREEGLPSAAEMVESVDTGRRLAGLVLELAEPYRTTVLLRYWHDLSSAEIARRQGIPEGTVRWRLKHGMDELRGQLDGSFGGRRSWHKALVAMISVRELAQQEALVASGGGLAGLAGVLVLGIAAVWTTRQFLRQDEAESAQGLEEDLAQGLPASGEVLVEAATDRTSVPATERETSVVPAARLERVVRVLDALGQPVGDADVVLDDGTNEGLAARTGPDGLAQFAGVHGATTVFVRAAGSYLISQPLAADEPTTTVRLTGGAELSGRLAVAGGPPGESVRLALALDHPVFAGPIPAPVAAHFGTARRAIVTTAPDGSFCFRGLDPRWSGTLELPKTWRLEGEPASQYGGPRLRFEHPERGLWLALVRCPHLSGTVLTIGAAPAAHARVELEISWRDATTSLLRDRADVEGAFVLRIDEERFAREHPDHARLSAKGSDGRFAGVRNLEGGEIVDGAELPPLVLDAAFDPRLAASLGGDVATDVATLASEPGVAARRLEILVTDEAGQPLVGATVELGPGTSQARHSRSDAYGTLVLEAPEDGLLDVLLSHPGYATRLFRADAAARTQPLVVVLERGHDLGLEFVDEAGVLLEGLEIEARTGDASPVWTATSIGRGRYRLSGLGAEPLLLRIARDERLHSVRVDPLAEELRITLGAPDEGGDS